MSNWTSGRFFNRIDFEDQVDERGIKGPTVVFRKRFGSIKNGRDYVITHDQENDTYELIFYPFHKKNKASV